MIKDVHNAGEAATLFTGILEDSFPRLSASIKNTTGVFKGFIAQSGVLKGTIQGIGKTISTAVTAHPILAALAALVAVAAVTNKILDSTHDNTTELLEKHDGITQKLGEIQSDIDDVTQSITDLEEKKLNITDPEDIVNLEKQIELLETRKTYLENQRKTTKAEAASNASDILNSMNSSSTYSGAAYSDGYAGAMSAWQQHWNRSAGLSTSSASGYIDLFANGTYYDPDNLENILANFSEIKDTLAVILDDDVLVGTEQWNAAYKKTQQIDEILNELYFNKATRDSMAKSDTPNNINIGMDMVGATTHDRIMNGLIEKGYENGSVTAQELEAEWGQYYDVFKEKIEGSGQTVEEYLAWLNAMIIENQEFASSAQDAGEAVTAAFDAPLTALEKLQNLMSGIANIDVLDKIYEDVADGGAFDWSSIINNEDFATLFGQCGEAYEAFINQIASSPTDISACQDSFENLILAYIRSEGVLDGLTEAQKAAAISGLESMGVTNATAIVEQQLRYEKVKATYATMDFSLATYDEIQALIAENEIAPLTAQAIARLALEKMLANKEQINTASDCQQIINLANSAKAGVASLAQLSAAKALFEKADAYSTRASTMYATEGDSRTFQHISNLADRYRKEAQELLNTPLSYEEITPTYTPVSGSSSSGSSGSGSSSDTEKDPEAIDWIETILDRAAKATEKIKEKVSSAFTAISDRLKLTADEFTVINDEIRTQQKAYDRYMQEANSVGLSSDLARRVREGSYEIAEYDAETKALIDEYKEWYDKAIDCKDAVDELHTSLSELYEEKFDMITSQFDSQLSQIDHTATLLENRLDMLESGGYKEDSKLYDRLIKTEGDRIKQLKSEYSELKKVLSEAVSSGKIEEGSEAWYSMKEDINEVNEAIQEAAMSVYEYNTALRDLQWDKFDTLQDSISEITEELEFLLDLSEDKTLFDDNSNFNADGISALGLHTIAYDTAMAQAEEYKNEMLKIQEELANDPSNVDLIERKNELTEAHRDFISAAQDEKQAIVDLVQEGIDLELEALQELIDSYNEALDSAKDLHDYQKNVTGYSEEISTLRKQLTAYAGDDSEESKSRIQQIKVELKAAEENLEEAQYDRYISEQKKLLDELYSQYEEILNKRVDDTNQLLSEIKDTVNDFANGFTANGESSWLTAGLFSTNEAITGAATAINGFGEAFSTTFKDNMNLWTSTIGTNLSDTLLSILTPTVENSNVTNPYDGTGDYLSGTTTNNAIGNIKEGNDYLYSHPYGDVDGDQKITSADARLILRASAGLENFTPLQAVSGDVDFDGMITSADSRLVLRKAGGFIDAYGFAEGGLVGDLETIAKSNGDDFVTINTLKRGEAVLTPTQTEQFAKLTDSLPRFTGLLDISKHLDGLRNSNVSGLRNNIEKLEVNIPIEHVDGYDDFISQLQKDTRVEKMLRAMTVDLSIGGSTLGKYKY